MNQLRVCGKSLSENGEITYPCEVCCILPYFFFERLRFILRKEAEIASLKGRMEDDQGLVAKLQLQIRELQQQIERLEEEVESEHRSRIRVSQRWSSSQAVS